MNTVLGREPAPTRSLGEFDAKSYPQELAEQLGRRAEVSEALLNIDVTDPEERIAAIPRLQQLLRRYPHPLAYELLIHAYVDAGRYDEAKGVAFAARQRRLECARSEYPEIRAEIESLQEWTAEGVDELRADREARRAPPRQTTE